MSKGLEAFHRYIDDIVQCYASGGIHQPRKEDKELIEKYLKALEIIIKHHDNSILETEQKYTTHT